MKKFLKAAGALVIAAVIGTGGYVLGTHSRRSSIVSAIPRVSVDNSSADEPADASPDSEAQSTPKASQEEKAPVKDVRIITKTEASAAQDNWTVIDEITPPRSGGTVRLYTSAQKEGGNMVWDDGQQWLLEYEDDDGYYQLVSKYISNGSVYCDVFEDENGEWLINAYVITGAGTSVMQYSTGESGFEEQNIYDSGSANKIASTIPNYR